ncbi:MAG: ABC transporter ATP-binding protein [Oscillospiraceae bacterium]|nr:ABC transporter ATP-binding protein [Oscillospiraceae bacterium]
MSTLKVKDLSIRTKKEDRPIVTDLSFSLSSGESLVLLGQSGCGKTMTCRAVMGLLDRRLFRTEGSILFDQTQLLHMEERKRPGLYGKAIAFVPQNPMTALDPSMRIRGQMDEHLRLHTKLDRKERTDCIRDALIRAGLTDTERVLRSFPHTLSGGMLQRVLIAMATGTKADLIIADEPTTALDVVHRNETVDAFLRLKEGGAAVLFVTHDFAAALRLGGDVLVMKDGTAVEQGRTRDVYAAPKTEYAASLVRASALSKGDGRADC